MSLPFEPYQKILVESYYPDNTSGLHGKVHIRPCSGQGIDTTMHVRCSKDLSNKYPVGTVFKITGKITDKEGSRPFIHSHHNWEYEVITKGT